MAFEVLMMLVGGVVAGLVGLLMAFVEDPDEHRLQGLPLTRADELREGSSVRLEGTLHAPQSLTAPTGEKCLYCRIEAFKYHRNGRRGEKYERLWSHAETAVGLVLQDTTGSVQLEVEGGEVRVAKTSLRAFGFATDRDQLPGTLSRDLPAGVRDEMTELRWQLFEEGESVVAAGVPRLAGRSFVLGGKDFVISNESDQDRARRRLSHRLLGGLLSLGGFGFAAWTLWTSLARSDD